MKMKKYIDFSQKVSVFHGRKAPEEGKIVGYGAIIDKLELPVPMPPMLIMISKIHRDYERDGWIVLGPRYAPKDTLLGHLIISLKYQGIDLLFYKKLFEKIEPEIIESWIRETPHSRFVSKVWFLYEWLMEEKLNVPDLETGNYDFLLDLNLHYGNRQFERSKRHRIYNNLPGVPGFCPLVFKTESIDAFIEAQLDEQVSQSLSRLPADILNRTSAFLLLKDSKASFRIENENPPQSRAVRWGRAIGEAGQYALSHDELLRLQQMIIEDTRFVRMGYRTEGGFIGEHDRQSGHPIPDHISARPQDLPSLMDGLLNTDRLIEVPAGLEELGYHPVLAAAALAFGFVFIHPFADGNGRIHRYLIHHVLARKRFTPEHIVFPISEAILRQLDTYRRLLESYSHPLLDFTQWQETTDHNIEVSNDTADYYRYFDATPFVEFLFECIKDTIDHIIPEEVRYLEKYDQMTTWLTEQFDMPERTMALLIRFLEQNGGRLSKKARENEFAALQEEEVGVIEAKYGEVFGG
jgi:Fic family protein